MTISLHLGDCLQIMPTLEAHSFDAIIADLPYGTTACKWDTVIPFKPLWKQYKRLIKKRGAIVLFGSQPFTSALVMSNVEWFRYCWVWDKVNKYTGALNANRMPLRRHEDIVIFYENLPTYNKQMRKGKPYKGTASGHGAHTQYGKLAPKRKIGSDGMHNPCSVLEIKGDVKIGHGLHPTQKPVALLEYLIRTYTNPGDKVLDNVMGSGTTMVACVNTGRDGEGIEQERGYFEISQGRVEKAQNEILQLALI